MKQTLPPSIVAALAEVADMADRLAESNCQTDNSCPYIDLTECQDNMDYVAACLTWKELEHAPAMLNAAARAYRQTFPADSLGWEDAGRLTLIADLIAKEWATEFQKQEWAARRAELAAAKEVLSHFIRFYGLSHPMTKSAFVAESRAAVALQFAAAATPPPPPATA